jgi:hypothetical protein
MLRGPLADPNFRLQFSGHETFPLRHLWLRKAYDAVKASDNGRKRSIFTDPDAIITFGVGKNMVSSIRHWALACDVIKEEEGAYKATRLGDFLFGEEGVDPYMEHPSTTWLLQWIIAGRPERTTTWYFAFNYFTAQTFERESLANQILTFCRERKGGERVSTATLKRDVECFIRSYVPRLDNKFSDDTMESVLAELGLIRAVGSKLFEFRRGPKPSLPDGVFNFALLDFWQWYAPDQGTLAVESIAHEPGSPGRVFKLDEHSLIERLARIDESSNGHFLWSDTAGVRNISRRSREIDPFALLSAAYAQQTSRRAA